MQVAEILRVKVSNACSLPDSFQFSHIPPTMSHYIIREAWSNGFPLKRYSEEPSSNLRWETSHPD
jgi:hypothetical protein